MNEEPHPGVLMRELRDAIRMVIKKRPIAVSEAQVLAVLASVMEDHASVAWSSLARRADPIPAPMPGVRSKSSD